jgi:hypothetical protein
MTAPSPTPEANRGAMLRGALARPALWVALGFLAWACWLLAPALLAGEYSLPGTGSQDSDVIRGAWSLGQAAWGLPDPIFTHRAFFPVGIKVVPLPFGSGLLLAPLQLLLGSLGAYDLTVLLLVATAGFSTAWLVREIGGSWGIGAIAGGALLAQPMLMHSISDGTPEHLAIWSLPAVLAAAWRAQRTGRVRWAAGTGLLLLLLLLDSPYMAVYGLVLAPFFLTAALLLRPAGTQGWWPRLRPMLLCAAFALPAVVIIALLYRGFTLAPQDFTPEAAAVELSGNSVLLRSWWGLESAPGSDHRGNLVPALIPSVMLVPTVLLALAGLKRSWPWLAAGLLMLALALGSNPDNAAMLGWWLGEVAGPAGRSAGQGIGDAVHGLNMALLGQAPFSSIRFPRRWLVPAALCLSVAGSLGLGTLLRLGLRSSALRALAERRRLAMELTGLATGLILATALLAAQPYLQPRQTTAFPELAFADWMVERPGDGAVLTLPTVRPGKPNTHRWELPVYAEISDNLRSADELYFQLVHRRPIYGYPALFTVAANPGLDRAAQRLVRDSNDMALPGMLDKEPPSSAYQPDELGERAAGRAWLVERGLRFVVLDLAVYQEPWLEHVISFYEPIAGQQRFEDGAGVMVLELMR